MARQRIAIIGGGVSGIVAAHYLSRRHEVMLFEAAPRLGGHTHTVTLPSSPGSGPDAGLPVDTGFIVYNDQTYPNFIRFLGELGIRGAPTDMSFSYSDEERGLTYAGTGPGGLFACRRHLAMPGFWLFLASVLRFWRRARGDLAAGLPEAQTLAEYLHGIGASGRLLRDYLGPMAQAIWSAPEADALAYPAASFLRFFNNHGLLDLPGRIKWRYLQGGSSTYVQAFTRQFPGEIHLAAPVLAVERSAESVLLRFTHGEARFDAAVLAAHADQALRLLPDADEQERAALAPWRYSSNRTLLHRDESHMPSIRRAWACWNVLRQAGDAESRPVRVTYWMNLLQRLPASRQWMVSLNPGADVAPEAVAWEGLYEHPIYTLESLKAQKLLPGISGRNRTYFCGSYHGYGFHEDGARSSVDLARRHFGIEP